MRSDHIATAATAALLLGALPLVAAHEEAGGMDMAMNMAPAVTASNATYEDTLPSYFRHPQHARWMYAHLALMLVGWTMSLPAALMLSVARSRYHLPAQVLFHIINGIGLFTGFVYSHSTPDLYSHNSHHPVGWIATSCTIAWTIMSVFTAFSGSKSERGVATSAPAERPFHMFQQYRDESSGRSSRDSGHGTERNSASLMGSRQGSEASIQFKPVELEDQHPNDDDDEESEKNGLLGDNRINRFVVRNVDKFATPLISKTVRFVQIVTEKLLLLIGFVAITTGFVVYGGIFRDRQIFSGLAHFIKGGIFFWYGLLTLGRWMGAFTEFGWAWNIRPDYPTVSRWKSRIPSAEFVESFVIWLYGASNVFMERFNAGEEWSAQDLEHVSITLLFFGGGLLGMMVESPWARNLMNTTVELQKEAEGEVGGEGRVTSHFHASGAGANSEQASDALWTQPTTYRISLNPLPGLVIMLLGIMMSGHHQTSMVSTMMHAQWGKLFCGFAMARAATYITLYIKPPTSHYPSRPPSELIASFCLTAGGMMFMFSARDVVTSIEANGLDAMAIFTVTMGFAGLLMAWEVLLYALKGWAVRKERVAAAGGRR